MNNSFSYLKENTISNSQSASVWDYFSLMKPRVMALVVFTACCGLYLSPGNVHPIIAFTGILCISIGAGSAAAINMWYDRDIDKIMKRTQNRPLVRNVIDSEEALSFGVVTGIFSVLLISLCVNIVSGILLAFTIFYYVFIYTIWLKRTSIQNVVIGGVSGALPPVIGWSISSGDISLESISLFAIIFMWTPPHSWALALFRMDDYKNCNVPMMPVIKGKLYTKKYILFYTLIMIPTILLPYYLAMVSIWYFVISSLMSLGFLYYTMMLFFSEDKIFEQKLFFYSIIYLFTIFLALIIFKL